MPIIMCALSLLCYVLFLMKERIYPIIVDTTSTADEGKESEKGLLEDTVTTGNGNLSPRFYLLAALHTIYILVFHLLQGFTPHLATVLWDENIIDAGYIAGISPLMVSIA